MAFENPTSILFDTKGLELAVSAAQAQTGSGEQPGILIAGSQSNGQIRMVQVDSAGNLFITGSVTAENVNNDQGDHGTPDQSWYMVITDGTSSTALGSAEASPLHVTGSVTVNQPVQVTGSVILGEQPIDVTPARCPTAVVSGTNATTSTITLLAANTTRCGATFFYAGSKTVFLKFGTGASDTDYSVRMSALSYYEIPFGYTGVVTAVWDSTGGGNNFIQTTEITNP